jgi:ADP-heptose:LPS heptosyltransferase
MTQLSFLCGHQVEQPDWDQTHGVEQTLRMARYLKAETKKPHLVYQVRSEEKDKLEQHPLIKVIRPGCRIVLQVGGGRRASWRDWPVQRWAELVHLILERLDAEIILLGGKDQIEKSHEIQKLLSPRSLYHNLVGQLTLSESAALLASARAVVSTDTGIMHLAFAVGTRVVALIHCNNPATRVGPYGYGNRHRIVQLPRPEGYRSPSDANMADLTAERVFENLKEVWT